ncbi:hypothetical protein CVIRNUC_009417 [Coccomyxa viridis]|uniref:Antifreeze protein n=1 Tax=Coccomyxa viridis TaxID=1274662 RepID=A0AAV1IGJ8_9CHLO|nr:hypothetical protein CVIRNUC_009417 [Coccomyxa viridis]
MARYTTPSLIVLAVLASAAFSLTEARDLQQTQGIEGTNLFDPSINKTTVMPTIDPAVNKTMPPFLNKTDIAMMLPAVNKTITADPAMNKTGIFNKTMMEPADPVINRTQLMPTITLPSKAAIKANITAALDPMTAINTTIATAAAFRPSGGGSTGDNAVGFGNVDAGGFNSVPGVQCATGLTQCNGGSTCVNLLSDTGYCGSCTTSCDFYTQVCGNGQCVCNEAGGFRACAARGGRCLNAGCPDGQTTGTASDINVQGTRGMPNAAASMSVTVG